MPRAKRQADLPVHYRALAFHPDGWSSARAAAKRRRVSMRTFMTEAVDSELTELVESVTDACPGKYRKFHRVPVDDRALGKINLGRRTTGIPAVALLRVCLARYAAKCTAASAVG